MFSWRYVESKILPWCREHGVGILAHSTLGKGLLTGRYKAGHEWSPDDERSNMVDFHGALSPLSVLAAGLPLADRACSLLVPNLAAAMFVRW